MSNVEVSGESAAGTAPVKAGEFKLEVVVVAVSDGRIQVVAATYSANFSDGVR